MGYRDSDFYETTDSVIPAGELVQHNNDADAHPALRAICDRALGLAESAEDAKNKNVSGGYAGLNAEGKLFVSLLPVITETLLGKGAVTAEKLSEEVLALFDSYVKKEDGKGLSSNDFTDEAASAVSEISALKRGLSEITEKYLDKNLFTKHVFDSSIHVSSAEIDRALKVMAEYAAKGEAYADDAKAAAESANDVKETAETAKEMLGETVEVVMSLDIEHTVDSDGILGVERKIAEAAEVLRKAGMLGMAGFPGIGEFSEIFNDYENNIAGIMGYYWADIDFSGENPVITFSKSQGTTDGEPFEVDYKVGDMISIVNNGHWTNCSTILSIEHNLVTVDSLPFEQVSVPSPVTPDDYSVFVVDKPFSGIIPLGRFARSSGEGCAAFERAGDAGGRDTRVLGQYGFTRGRDTVADYCAAALGKSTKALGKTSFAFGNGAEALVDGSFAFGLYTIATVAQQMALGRFNIKDAEGIYALIFGNGTYSKRSNAFTLDWDGNAWLSGDIKVGGKSYSDPDAEAVATEATIASVIAAFTTKSLIEGITAEMSINLLYDIGIDSFDLKIDGLLLGETTPIGEAARIASEALKSDKTHVVFYKDGEKVCEAKARHTLKNCGMLFVTEE